MKDAEEYLAYLKALIVMNDQILHWTVIREETQGDVGLFRYRLTLRDGGMLEIFERFRITPESVITSKYSFHWQDAAGDLRKRWDNAAHHPEIPTQPHHLHVGSDGHVLPHGPMTTALVLAIVAAEISGNLPPRLGE